MDVRRHKTPQDFLDRAGAWLEAREAENHLILGIAQALTGDPGRYGSQPWLLTVEEERALRTAALMTPPWKAILTFGPSVAIRAVADYFFAHGAPVPAVLAPLSQGEVFAEHWKAKTGRDFTRGREQGVYVCEAVVDPPPVPGRLRPAEPADRAQMEDFLDRFRKEVGLEGEAESVENRVEPMIAAGRLHVWDRDGIVSIAGWTGATPRGVRLSAVFTHPAHRRRGYASNCVAAVTRKLFAAGRRFCFLYTDMANPTSNSVYQKIGYRRVLTHQDFHFAAD
jgi:predicted GNAT family acetyltransferase